ncbi:heparinase II/III family protein [Parabacteroides sp. Marseille-P3160]|uniref:heparinase II/III domain-containing protein n=1 Tax=Parabacteroides sp. Marseille-P3160 TaxID=1917887 RepID=UPI0009BAC54D|nr:heparinase II/III family protein [Parabacteroides sp. Marseille-P3160]
MKYKLFLLFLFIPYLMTACGKSDKDLPGGEEEETTLSPDDDGAPPPSGSYDYSAIAAHPRLLMNRQEEERLKVNLTKNNDLAAVHEAILKNCNEMLNAAPVTRVMEGKRLLSVSRTALKRIFYLSYGYRMTGEPKYLTRAEREILAVCDFSDWNPSHFLDVGEMALGVAIGYDWLYDKLKPETRDKMRKALKSKAFEPSYVGSYNWFLTNRANWNQVCNAGLTYAALAIYEGAKKESVEIIERCLQTIKLPLEDYGPDGNYTEGYMYWSYGTDFQVMLFSGLETALGSDKDLHKTPGFMKTAEYMLFMSGINGLCYNYSDSYNQEGPRPSMFWFAQKSNNSSLLYKEIQLIANGGAYIKSFGEDRLLPMTMVFANLATFENISAPEKKIWIGQGVTPVVLIRTSWGMAKDKYIGMKGGKAESSHAHMDAGSFVYDSDGIRWAMDLGMQSYAPLEAKGVDLWNMGQNSQRWDVFRLSNKAHNTLTINGKRHQVSGMATVTETFDTDEKRGATIDLAPVFSEDLSMAQRTILLVNNDFLQIEDRVQAKKENTNLRWSMVTPADVEIEDSKTIKLSKNGKIMYLTVEAPVSFTLKTWSTEPATDFDEPNPGTLIVGFEAELPSNEPCHFIVKLSDKK